jgi:Ca2+-binding EF-hand superfamily protein
MRTFMLPSLVVMLLVWTTALPAADDKSGDSSSAAAKPQAVSGSAEKTSAADKFTALFEKLDANHDGQITSDEVPDEQRRLFQRLLRRADRNGDGKLSRDEFTAGMAAMEDHGPESAGEGGSQSKSAADHGEARHDDGPPRQGRAFGGGFGGAAGGGGFGGGGFGGFAGGAGGGPLMGMALFHALDTNHDGKLDAKEIAAASETLKKMANSDGEITRDDLLKSMPNLAGGFGGGGAAGGLPAGEPNGEAILKRIMQQLDKNGDGKIQKDELPPRLQQRFDELDTNHDGALDETELKAILPRIARQLRAERDLEPEENSKKKQN